MTKTLYILRHAKSSWEFAQLDDYDRPLNQRGERDAPRMADWLSRQSDPPQKIYASGAKRALSTAQIMQGKLGCTLVKKSELYACSNRKLLEIIRAFDDRDDCLMLVGHNPELTSLINSLSDAYLDNLPTCGLVRIRFVVEHWSNINEGVLDLLMWPKKL